jgi:pyruvate/2-oxoglutarate dehydrogenase complex dihydrolipoamide acyltransferase (E2) component
MDIKLADNLWASNMLPEGFLLRWLASDGSVVRNGEAIAEVKIEDAIHEVIAPIAGRLRITLAANSVVEPGSILGTLAHDP